MLLRTIIFLIRGSYLNVNFIKYVLDDFLMSRVDEGYLFSGVELSLMREMRGDVELFEGIVNEAKCEELGYMIALYALPYIEKGRNGEVGKFQKQTLNRNGI